MRLYDNAFSPFARKVRIVLDHKGLAYEALDGLAKVNHDALLAVNSRIEIPVLVDGDVTVVNSADIVAYLEHRYSEPPVYPSDPATRVRARAWERTADTLIDSILADIGLWLWAERPDSMPTGLREAAQGDLGKIYDALDEALKKDGFLFGDLSIADIALFPHLTSVGPLGVPFSDEHHPNLTAWLSHMNTLEVCQADLERLRAYFSDLDARGIERRKIFWRGDRIEWLLARGFHEWLLGEIEAERVLWPTYGPP